MVLDGVHDEEHDWASLPGDLLHSIFHRLPAEDCVRFGAVCSRWRSTAAEIFRHPHHQVPLLLHRLNRQEATWSLSNVTTQTTVGELEWPYPQRFCGCSHGWLILFNSDTALVSLSKPFSHESIPLPVLQRLTPPAQRGRSSIDSVQGLLSGSPDNDKDYVLMLVYDFDRKLAFIKASDHDWTYIDSVDDKQYDECQDVTYSNEEEAFFALSHGGRVVLCIDVKSGLMVKKLTPRSTRPTHLDWNHGQVFYLTKSWEQGKEHLLMVVMTSMDSDDLFETKFQIYRLENEGGGQNHEWIEVGSLGDTSLFLGDRHSFSFMASTSEGYQPNSIYFYNHNQIGVCDLEDRSILALQDGSLRPHLKKKCRRWLRPPSSPPIWIVPTINMKC